MPEARCKPSLQPRRQLATREPGRAASLGAIYCCACFVIARAAGLCTAKAVKTLSWLLTGAIAGALASGSVLAAGNLPPPAIDLSKCFGPFRSESYVEVAAALQALPEPQRIAQLRAWAACPDVLNDAVSEESSRQRSRDSFRQQVSESEGVTKGRELDASKGKPGGALEQQVILLCRMLFEAIPGHGFRSPGIGAGFSLMRIGQYESPLEPMGISNGIPFLLARPGLMGGWHSDLEPGPERAADYLEYCLKETRWTSCRYAPAEPAALQKALDGLLQQTSWPRPPTVSDIRSLTNQIRPFEPPALRLGQVEISGRGVGGGAGFNTGDIRPPPTKSEVGVPLIAIEKVSGGLRPYHFMAVRQIPGVGGAPPELKTIAQGMGRPAGSDPFVEDRFMVTWTGADAVPGASWVFKVVDARGDELEQKLQIPTAGGFLIYPPTVGLTHGEPLRESRLTTAKEKE